MADFDINAALKAYLDDPQSITTPEADPALLDSESDPEAFTPGLINSIVNPIADAIGENPEAVTQASNLDSLYFLLKCAPTVSLNQPARPYIQALDADCDFSPVAGRPLSSLPFHSENSWTS